MCVWSSRFIPLVLIATTRSLVHADTAKEAPDLAEYRSVATAQTASTSDALKRPISLGPSYLGGSLDPQSRQLVSIDSVDAESPAARGRRQGRRGAER